MNSRPPHDPSSIEEEIELRTRANPAYRDTPIGRGEVRQPQARPIRRRPIPSRNDRPLMWRLLGVPSPRELVRALVIDGYPRSLHRWAFGRVGSAINWTCAAGGVLAAFVVLWFLDSAGYSPRVAMAALLGLAISFILIAMVRFLPILSAIRYAARWNRGMQGSKRA